MFLLIFLQRAVLSLQVENDGDRGRLSGPRSLEEALRKKSKGSWN